MRIIITSYDAKITGPSGAETAPSAISILHETVVADVALAQYLDMQLADVGICGGVMRLTAHGHASLNVAVDYWSPRRLSGNVLKALIGFTRAQFEDGAGEGGFRISIANEPYIVHPSLDKLSAEQVDDGTPVPLPSRIARAARDADIPKLKLAVSDGEAIDSRLSGYTGLHFAILNGNADVVTWLLDRGADPNAIDPNGFTPLALCAMANQMDDEMSLRVASALLKHGAKFYGIADKSLSIAASRGKIKLSAALEALRN